LLVRWFKRGLPWLALCAACNGNIVQHLDVKPFDAVTIDAPVALSTSPGFADERGGGIFVDPVGAVVRLRADGTVARLESHPGNSTPAGVATAAWPLGPYVALVATDKGLYVAESGWLIEPAWRDVLSASGLRATALADNGVAWVAHEAGLFRIEEGVLSELKSDGASITGITGLAVAPSLSGGTGVWFAQGEKLSWAEQTSKTAFTLGDSGLQKAQLKGGITALAGLAASPTSAGELWAIANDVLWRHDATGWKQFNLGATSHQILSAGRVLWLYAGDALFRYDADAQAWTEANGPAANAQLLAVDATGAAWINGDGKTSLISAGVVARVEGMFQNVRVYSSDVVVKASVPGSSEPTQMIFRLDDGESVLVPVAKANPGDGPAASQLYFTMGGVDAAGRDKPYSLAGLKDGMHTLTVVTRFAGSETTRALHFDFKGGSNVMLSYAADIAPIQSSRCAKCHTSGPGHELIDYDEWKADAERISIAVAEQRMPADGLLDPASIQKIQRWVAAGANP
jgi:hypothetical protein